MADGTFSKLPDVWFDVYARLIPGATIIGLVLLKFGIFPDDTTIGSATWIIFFGYVLGHLIQPATTFLTIQLIERNTGVLSEKAEAYQVLKPESRGAMVLSKQHAETVGFFAVALGCLFIPFSDEIALFLQLTDQPSAESANVRLPDRLFYALTMLFLLFSVERAFEQLRRSRRYLNQARPQT
ncbi:hypothetical protein [Gymnodinialimonas hymeniacidonis]|uniref:hypothetical protein n=1 Tax=Gymnodinialimonas hymeniacidonis TaxID=3126508 RepID=UPI0034C5D65A